MLSAETNVSSLFERVKVQFIAYHRSLAALSVKDIKSYECPLRCGSSFKSISRIPEHIRMACRHARTGITHKRQLSKLFLSTKALIKGTREGEGSLYRINEIVAVSPDRPVSMLCHILDPEAPGGFVERWIRRVDLMENNYQNMVSKAFRQAKTGKIPRISTTQKFHGRQIPVLSIFNLNENIDATNEDDDLDVVDEILDDLEIETPIPKFGDLQDKPSMEIVKQVIEELLVEESRKIRVRHLISKFINWVVEKLGWDTYSQIAQWHVYLIQNWQPFINWLSKSCLAAATIRNYTEDSVCFFKQLELILNRNGEFYWAGMTKSILNLQMRFNSICEKRKLVECGESNSVDGLVGKKQFLTLEELEMIKCKSQEVIEEYVCMDFEEINELGKKACDRIQAALLWNIVFQLNPQRNQWFSNLKVGKELLWDVDTNQYYFNPTADSTKMFFHRRQIRHENLGVDMKLALKKWLYGGRDVLSGKKVSIEDDTHLSQQDPIPRGLKGKSLFVNLRGSPLMDQGLIVRLRGFLESDCPRTESGSKITLRSLRQVFQYHFYRTNPSFAQLRDFNRSMDHTDTTGLIYYNRADARATIHPPTASLIPAGLSNVESQEEDEETQEESQEQVEVVTNPYPSSRHSTVPPSRSPSAITPSSTLAQHAVRFSMPQAPTFRHQASTTTTTSLSSRHVLTSAPSRYPTLPSTPEPSPSFPRLSLPEPALIAPSPSPSASPASSSRRRSRLPAPSPAPPAYDPNSAEERANIDRILGMLAASPRNRSFRLPSSASTSTTSVSSIAITPIAITPAASRSIPAPDARSTSSRPFSSRLTSSSPSNPTQPTRSTTSSITTATATPATTTTTTTNTLPTPAQTPRALASRPSTSSSFDRDERKRA